MQKLSARQRTLAGALEFSGFGVHSGLPVTLRIKPAAPDTGYLIDEAYDAAGTAKAKARATARKAKKTARSTVNTVRDAKPNASVSADGSASASGSSDISY